MERIEISINRLKELILNDKPDYYDRTEKNKKEIISIWVDKQDIQKMYDYMENTK